MSPRPAGQTPGSSRERVYNFVRNRILEGLPPTVREVQEALGFKAVQSAREHLEKLVLEGKLTKMAGLSRGYGLPGFNPMSTAFGSSGEAYQASWIPILGRVQAGAMTTAVEDVEGYLSLENTSGRVRNREELFALRVQGESMLGAGIYPNDIVVVRWQSTANIGDIVVALVDDEATVKTYWVKNGYVELRPENPDFETIVPNPEELIILGKVVEMRRYFESTPFDMHLV